MLDGGVDERRLADPCLTGDHHCASGAVGGAIGHVTQLRELEIPPDQHGAIVRFPRAIGSSVAAMTWPTPIALVRRPGPRLADGIVTQAVRPPIDDALAAQQWNRYVDALRTSGWQIVEVEPADDCPDAVFVEDALVMFDELAVLTLPGAPSRRPETGGAEAAARALGFDPVRIEPPATLDGGDVLKVGRVAYVGVSGRTNMHAVEQLQEVLAGRGWDVRPVPVTKVLHLKSAVTALPDGTVVGYADHVDDPAAFDRFMAVPEPSGSHVVVLGDDRVLMAGGAPKSVALFRSLGLEPIEVGISEFEKLDGCVTCLSVRIRA
jgi:dimethylargininase